MCTMEQHKKKERKKRKKKKEKEKRKKKGTVMLQLKWNSYDSSRINLGEYLTITHTKIHNGIVTIVAE